MYQLSAEQNFSFLPCMLLIRVGHKRGFIGKLEERSEEAVVLFITVRRSVIALQSTSTVIYLKAYLLGMQLPHLFSPSHAPHLFGQSSVPLHEKASPAGHLLCQGQRKWELTRVKSVLVGSNSCLWVLAFPCSPPLCGHLPFPEGLTLQLQMWKQQTYRSCLIAPTIRWDLIPVTNPY